MRRNILLALTLEACVDYDLLATNNPGGSADPDGDGTGPGHDTDELLDCSSYSYTPTPVESVDDACTSHHQPGKFDPIVEWRWDENSERVGVTQVMSTPVVANLTDDNGDGTVDSSDVPEVVFAAFPESGHTNYEPSVLVAISGDGSEQEWSLDEVSGQHFSIMAGLAIGDLDDDGTPEICASGYESEVICLDTHGKSPPTMRFTAGVGAATRSGYPALADLDGDGHAEVLVAGNVYDDAGVLLTSSPLGQAGRPVAEFMTTTPFAVDWDGDGFLEVVVGDGVFDRFGTIVLNTGFPDGFPAVADLDADGRPDLISISEDLATATSNAGLPLWSVSLPGGCANSEGGPPTVADFDGDGEPEIGVAGCAVYTVLDTDGTLLWSSPIQDASSRMTGSSVFDFEGDGVAEVVYSDEENLRVYDGPTGSVLLDMPEQASATWLEYPLVVDVDGDGQAEIVVASNNYAIAGWTGITVIGSASDSWAPGRTIWNQHAYFITNVNDDAGIPSNPADNWATWNNFRAGGDSSGPPNWRSNLETIGWDACAMECSLDRVEIVVDIGNDGLASTGAAYAELRGSDGTTLVGEWIPPMSAGSSMRLGPFELTAEQWGVGEATLVLDTTRLVDECDEADNSLNLGPFPC